MSMPAVYINNMNIGNLPLPLRRFLSSPATEGENIDSLEPDVFTKKYGVTTTTMENGRPYTSTQQLTPLQLACANGRIDQLAAIQSTVGEKLFQEMIKDDCFYTMAIAAQYGHLDVIKVLFENSNLSFSELIATSYTRRIFKIAADFGHIPILDWLETQAMSSDEKARSQGEKAETREYMLNYADCFVFNAMRDGNIPTLEWVLQNGRNELISEDDRLGEFLFFKHLDYFTDRALKREDHTMLNWLLSLEARFKEKFEGKVKEKVIATISQDFNSALEKAITQGNRVFASWLQTNFPNEYQAAHIPLFRAMVIAGKLDEIKAIAKENISQLQEMISANNYQALKDAARGGHADICQWLVEQVDPEHVEAMITNSRCDAFSTAAWLSNATNREKICSLFLNQNLPGLFAYIEQHDPKDFNSVDYVTPYVNNRLSELKQRMSEFTQTNPNDIFDLRATNQEIQLYYYILRHLIRCNDDSAIENIQMLLTIPSIKSLLTTSVRGNATNECLRLALELNNQHAAHALIREPAVRALAQQNNFYVTEHKNDFDLSAMANDNESAMLALNPDEIKMVDTLKARYAQQMESKGGVDAVFEEFKTLLQQRYLRNPATAAVGEKKDEQRLITLPLTWTELQQMAEFNPGTKATHEQIYAAYAKNCDHSAWRYLSKPNQWLNRNASFVYVDPNNNDFRWATFEDYKPLIAYFFLAASDEAVGSFKETSPDDRLTLFIEGIALIGRGHNWDKTRPIMRDGNVVMKDGKVLTEEYDDLEPDRPSCFSGVKQRLFRAVVHHPLLTAIDKHLIHEELREFIYTNTEKKLSRMPADAIEAIAQAIDSILTGEDLTDVQKGALANLNFSKEEVSSFNAQLQNKYQNQYSAALQLYIGSELTISEDEHHFTKHFYSCNLEKLLTLRRAQPEEKNYSPTQPSRFFGKRSRSAESPEPDDTEMKKEEHDDDDDDHIEMKSNSSKRTYHS